VFHLLGGVIFKRILFRSVNLYRYMLILYTHIYVYKFTYSHISTVAGYITFATSCRSVGDNYEDLHDIFNGTYGGRDIILVIYQLRRNLRSLVRDDAAIVIGTSLCNCKFGSSADTLNWRKIPLEPDCEKRILIYYIQFCM